MSEVVAPLLQLARADHFALALDGEGYALAWGPGDPARIAKSGGADDRVGLVRALGRLRPMDPDLHVIAIATDDAARWRDVLTAADIVITAGYSQVLLASLLDAAPAGEAENGRPRVTE